VTYLQRLTERVFGRGAQLVPATNRYLIGRAPLAPFDDELPERVELSAEARTPIDLGIRMREPRAHASRNSEAPLPEPTASIGRAAKLLERGDVSSRLAAHVDDPFARPATPAPAIDAPRERPAGTTTAAPATARHRSADAAAHARLLPRSPATPAASLGAAPVAPVREREEPPTVHVHIGRIDVRAVQTPAPRAQPARSPLQPPSLDEHLRARDRGRR
jgi:hypothetical protein